MYLVLTAMLALNVSKDVLNAFSVVNENIVTTNDELEQKSNLTYAQFKKELDLNETQVGPFWDKAKTAMELSDEMVKYIASLRDEIISKTEKIPLDSALNRPVHLLQKKDDYLTPTNILFGLKDNATGGKANELKNKLYDYRKELTELIEPKYRDQINIGLQTEGIYKDVFGQDQSWEIHYFYEIPLAATVPILNQFIAEVKNAELEVINGLLYEISAESYKYDRIEAKVLPKSNYIFEGDHYISEVIVAAYDTSRSPELYLVHGADSLAVSMKESAEKISGRNGRMYLDFPATKPGLHKYAGFVSIRNNAGIESYYHFNDQYTVAQPSVTVSATKMNVLYAGVENPISISVTGIPEENISAVISGGKLLASRTKGNWIALVPSESKQVSITVSAEIDGSIKSMGTSQFRVKKLPNPEAFIVEQTDGYVSRNGLINAGKITAKMPEDFEFDYSFPVLSFRMSMQRGFSLYHYDSPDENLTEEMRNEIRRTNRGQSIIFEDIVAQWPDGSTKKLAPLLLTIN